MADQKELWAIVKKFHVCMATTWDGEMFRSRPMSPALDEDQGLIRFLTEASSSIVEEVQEESDINLSFADQGSMDFVSLSGKARSVRDPLLVKQLWNPYADAWFKNGPNDPKIRVVSVRPTEAQFWDATGSRILQVIELARAKITGSTPDMGREGKVDFS